MVEWRAERGRICHFSILYKKPPNTSHNSLVWLDGSSDWCGLSLGVRMTRWSKVSSVTWLPRSFPKAVSGGPQCPSNIRLHIMAPWASSLHGRWSPRKHIWKSKGASQRSLRPRLKAYTHPLTPVTGQIWALAQIPGKGKKTLLHDGSMTRSHCKGACRIDGIVITTFENTICCEGNLRNHSKFHSEWLKWE